MKCSSCGESVPDRPHYCPKCGSLMGLRSMDDFDVRTGMPLGLLLYFGVPSLCIGSYGLYLLIRMLGEPRNEFTVPIRGVGVLLFAAGFGVLGLFLWIYIASNRRRR